MTNPENDDIDLRADCSSAADAADETQAITQDLSESAESPSNSGDVPEFVGRYRIDRLLGEGGFGAVYLARDDELQRFVTVKIPHAHRITSHAGLTAFLTEARTLAKLEHPNVVPVHDVGHTSDGICYVVSRYIDGSDLRARAKTSPLTIAESCDLVATIAEALHYVHTHGVIHRDVKPGNILLDKRSVPYLADFGLALLEETAAKSGVVVGSPSYMSPEQARGENHLVRGTADIFSLGLILYELISGVRVFRGDSALSVLQKVCELEVTPLREVNHEVPRELERICMKAISKRASDRHQTAVDLADDLHHFLAHYRGLGKSLSQPANDEAEDASAEQSKSNLGIPVVPRGLRSFGDEDAGFYSRLLPGPYDRDGMPESVLFWKRRVEQADSEDSFRVGLIYGPSGCGKSSFIKAGLMPILASHVTPVFVEAAPDATENRLLLRLRRRCPYLDTDLGLRESIAKLRHGDVMGQGKKVLIVIDQFEQWLYSVENPERSELADALRQCDGEHVQCILLVRDDFWLAFSRFMEHLEIELRHSKNMMLVDLFDPSHARRVLLEFGRAFGQLPTRESELTRDQRAFLTQTVEDLSEHGKVMPVRLALLAEMIKGKPWSTSTLKRIGGTEGVGVMFLDENFVSRNAPAGYQAHCKAVFAVLGELLPQPGTDLKGHMKSSDDLLEASGYRDRPKMFESLLRILDSELHLITRTDPEGRGDDASASYSGIQLAKTSYYQLAHDYLVSSIRQWQARMRQTTRRGRAEIRLAERAEVWQVRPEPRHLPSLIEWISIKVLASSRRWDDVQRRMMKQATRRYTTRLLVTAVVLIGGIFALTQYLAWNRANALTDQLLTAQVNQVPEILDQMTRYKSWTVERLGEIRSAKDSTPQQHLFSNLALLRAGRGSVSDIQPALLTADPQTLQLLCHELDSQDGLIAEALWEQLDDSSIVNESDASGRPFNRRFNAALVLAQYDPPPVEFSRSGETKTNGSSDENWREHATFVADQLIDFANIDRQYYPTILSLIRPAKHVLLGRLAEVMIDPEEKELRQNAAQTLLLDLLRDEPVTLTDHFLLASVDQIMPTLQLIDSNRDAIRPLLDEVVAQPIDHENLDWQTTSKRTSMAAALLLRHNASHQAIWSVFRNEGIPDARTMLIQRVEPLGVDPRLIAMQLQIEADSSIQCGLIQALGEFNPDELEGDLKDRTLTLIKGWFASANQASLRSTSLWFLRQWGESTWLEPRLTMPVAAHPSRDWRVDDEGHLMIRLPPIRPDDTYVLEAGAAEVTLDQLQRFDPEFRCSPENTPTGDSPATKPTYHEAVAYCNWLTRTMNLGESEVCYSDRTDPKADAAELHPDYRQRTGYRLATAEEWFHIRRGGSKTSFPFGENKDLVSGYAVFNERGLRGWPIGTAKPNDYGVFAMLTGLREWVSEVDPENPHRRGLCGVSFRYRHFRNYGSVEAERIGWGLPDLAYTFQGFRVVRSVPIQSPDEEQ